jgi:hypothetical protein
LMVLSGLCCWLVAVQDGLDEADWEKAVREALRPAARNITNSFVHCPSVIIGLIEMKSPG